MTTVTDDYMKEMMGKTRPYCVVVLRKTPRSNDPGSDRIVWEHGRRNFQLRADGVLSIVCPVRDASDLSGIGIFDASLEKTKEIMDGDPGVKAGIFTYEVHPTRSFPGDCL